MQKKIKKNEQAGKNERWLTAYQAILADLRAGRYEERGRLPAEEKLAKELDISRTILRDALAVLESEGFIIRTRGVGTIVNQEVVEAKGRLDLENDFLETIRQQGYAARQKTLSCGQTDQGFVVEKCFYADEKPAIFLCDQIPLDRIRQATDMPSRLRCETTSFYKLLEEEGWGSVKTVLMDMTPYLYRDLGEEAGILDLGPEDLVIKTVERGFDVYGKVNLISTIYYVASFFDFSLLTRAGHHKLKPAAIKQGTNR